ncbi:hypothetical protein Droror1_Dr00017882 [Drosera rotundifolia]
MAEPMETLDEPGPHDLEQPSTHNQEIEKPRPTTNMLHFQTRIPILEVILIRRMRLREFEQVVLHTLDKSNCEVKEKQVQRIRECWGSQARSGTSVPWILPYETKAKGKMKHLPFLCLCSRLWMQRSSFQRCG